MRPLRSLSRRRPRDPLLPAAAWALPFGAFMGVHVVSESCAIDGRRDEDCVPVWGAPLHPDAFWRSPDGYELRAVPDPAFDPETMVLLAPDGGRCGFYSGGQLWIDPPHRGRGLAPEMVLAMAEALDASPAATPGGMGYSPAGHASHLRAWRLAVLRAAAAGLPVPPENLRAAAAPGIPD